MSRLLTSFDRIEFLLPCPKVEFLGYRVSNALKNRPKFDARDTRPRTASDLSSRPRIIRCSAYLCVNRKSRLPRFRRYDLADAILPSFWRDLLDVFHGISEFLLGWPKCRALRQIVRPYPLGLFAPRASTCRQRDGWRVSFALDGLQIEDRCFPRAERYMRLVLGIFGGLRCRRRSGGCRRGCCRRACGDEIGSRRSMASRLGWSWGKRFGRGPLRIARGVDPLAVDGRSHVVGLRMGPGRWHVLVDRARSKDLRN